MSGQLKGRDLESVAEFAAALANNAAPNIWSYLERNPTQPGFLRALVQEDIHARLERREQPWIEDYINKSAWEQRSEILLAFQDCLYADDGAVAEQLGVRRIGRYTTTQVLGFGGFGTVLLGRGATGDRAAIKIAHAAIPEAARILDVESVILRRLQESRIGAHPRFPKELEKGSLTNHRRFLAMSHLPGVPLSDWLMRRNAEPLRRVKVCRQLIELVRALHDERIYHGDLSSGNVIVAEHPEDPTVSLVDFASAGFGYLRHREVAAVTDAYAAPELLAGQDTQPDSASDMWSLATLVYEVLSGEHPFGVYTPSTSADVWLSRLQRGRSLFPLSDLFGEGIQRAMTECFQINPKNRQAISPSLLLRALPDDADILTANRSPRSPSTEQLPGSGAELAALRSAYLNRVIRRFELVRVPLVDPQSGEQFIPIGSIVIDLPLTLEREVEDRYERERLSLIGYAARVEAQADQQAAKDAPFTLGHRIESHQATALVGPPGCGKSTLLTWAITRFATEALDPGDVARSPPIRASEFAPRVATQGLFPIVLICRDLGQMSEEFSLEDLVRKQLQCWGFTTSQRDAIAQTCSTMMSDGRAIVFVDGLDEVPGEGRARICRLLNNLVVATSCKCVMTSRATGFKRIQGDIPRFDFVMVAPLTDSHRREYIKLWSMNFPTVPLSDLDRYVCENPKLRRLCENMLMLALVVQLCEVDRALPGRRVDIFRRIVEIMVERQRPGVQAPLTINEVWPNIEVLALGMRREGWQHVDESTAIEYFRSARAAEPALHARGAREPEILLEDMLARIDLLNVSGKQVDPATGLERRTIQFFHQSMQEYFAGQAIIHRRGGLNRHPLDVIREILSGKGAHEDEVQDRPIPGLPSNRRSEPVIPENWRETISMAIADIGGDQALSDTAMELVLPTSSTSPRAARARAVLAMRCLADDPNVSPAMVGRVVDAAAAALIEEDGATTHTHTQMDESIRLAAASRSGKLVEDYFLKAYCGTTAENQNRLGRAYLTALQRTMDPPLNADNAEQLLGAQIGSACAEEPIERTRAFLNMTGLLYSAKGGQGVASLDFLSPTQRAHIVSTTLRGINAANPAVCAAAVWCLGWGTRAKYAKSDGAIRLQDPELSELQRCLVRSDIDDRTLGLACLVLSLREGDTVTFAQRDWVYEWALIADGKTLLRDLPEPKGLARGDAVAAIEGVLARVPSRRAKQYAAVALGRLGVFSEATIESLIEIVHDDLRTSRERDEAVAYLTWSRSSRAMRAIRQMASLDQAAEDYLHLRGVLSLLGSKDVHVITQQLIQGDSEAFTYARGLTGAEGTRGHVLLRNLAGHPNPTVREAVANVLTGADARASQSKLRGLLLELLGWVGLGVCIVLTVSPIDLMPDFVPVLGQIDDVVYIILGIVFARIVWTQHTSRKSLVS